MINIILLALLLSSKINQHHQIMALTKPLMPVCLQELLTASELQGMYMYLGNRY